MTPFQEIEHDLDWREVEIATFRILLTDNQASDQVKKVLFRAAWALLYAHYEGFCKLALTVYYDTIQNTGAVCKDLPQEMQTFALKEQLVELRKLPTLDLISKIRGFESEIMESSITFPNVDAGSNLKPDRLKTLLRVADISIPSLDEHDRKLATLVSRRNQIAHGERDMINELPYYLNFENAVITVMYDLALAIDEKLSF